MGSEISHPLDNPSWAALRGRQSEFAITGNNAMRYRPEVFMMAAIPDDSEASVKNLADLVPKDDVIGIIGLKIAPENPYWQELRSFRVFQMVAGEVPEYTKVAHVELTDGDLPEMLELVKLTEPGPFAPRTIELGKYLGLRLEGQLVAMAGERIKVEGFTEVSAICTHPDHRRKGYAKALTCTMTQEILNRGEKAFLHVMAHNEPAIRLYERLGYVTRKELPITAYRRV
ncbi:GNAT family N-acetyltransferase [Candidatus Bathyarchaeota archaeon]|nr:GNAT family N-acetyltransferase [Candidatus Bathyarchaeota archaeon]